MSVSPHPISQTRAVVLGGGVAGLAAADRLARKGFDVTVLEASDVLGGMHHSVRTGPYIFDIGSIFYEDDARLFGLAPGLRDLCPSVRRVQRRIDPDGTIRHYPLEPTDLLRWPKPRLVRAAASLLWSRAVRRRDGTLEAICQKRLGAVLFRDTGLRHYIEHFNGVAPSEIGEAFFFDRMAFVDRATQPGAVMRSALRALRGKPFRASPRPGLRVRPLEGYTALFAPIAQALRDRGVDIRTQAPVSRVHGRPGALRLETPQGRVDASVVVSTIPIDALFRMLFSRPSGVQSLGLLSLFVSARSLDQSVGNVLFNFHPAGGWKRATILSRLLPKAEGTRDYFTVEVTVPPGSLPNTEAAYADFAKHVQSLGVADGLHLEGSHMALDAYPVIRPGQADLLSDLLGRIEAAGVVSVGRQGRFEYLPTSSRVIRRVVEELETV